MLPTPEQISQVKAILQSAFRQLVLNDKEIFSTDLKQEPIVSNIEQDLNRKLHEITINHRLAYYIENIIKEIAELKEYNVDIEYNRFYNGRKELNIGAQVIIARPDIIIHSRTNQAIHPQHYLVIEAKKAAITQDDIDKIKGFISDNNYNYLFGLTISYNGTEKTIICTLYYFNRNGIIWENLSIS